MEGEVYLVGTLEGCYKIGWSTDSGRRLLSFAPLLPVTLTVLHRITTDDAPWLERKLHTAFAHRRAVGEWFRLTESDASLFKSLVAHNVAGRFSSELAKLIRQNRPPKPKPITPKPIAPVAKTAAPPALPETAPPKLDYWNNPDQIMLWTVREGTPGLVAIRRSALAQYEAEREEAKAARVSHPDYGIECSMSSAAL